jgi:hypothetical protein
MSELLARCERLFAVVCSWKSFVVQRCMDFDVWVRKLAILRDCGLVYVLCSRVRVGV